MLLDIKAYEPRCSGISKIDYAATNDYFYVLLGCFEMDDRLFLFNADGSEKKEITGKWDVVNSGIVNWDPDGKSLFIIASTVAVWRRNNLGKKGRRWAW